MKEVLSFTFRSDLRTPYCFPKDAFIKSKDNSKPHDVHVLLKLFSSNEYPIQEDECPKEVDDLKVEFHSSNINFKRAKKNYFDFFTKINKRLHLHLRRERDLRIFRYLKWWNSVPSLWIHITFAVDKIPAIPKHNLKDLVFIFRFNAWTHDALFNALYCDVHSSLIVISEDEPRADVSQIRVRPLHSLSSYDTVDGLDQLIEKHKHTLQTLAVKITFPLPYMKNLTYLEAFNDVVIGRFLDELFTHSTKLKMVRMADRHDYVLTDAIARTGNKSICRISHGWNRVVFTANHQLHLQCLASCETLLMILLYRKRYTLFPKDISILLVKHLLNTRCDWDNKI